MFTMVLCPGTPEGSTGSGSGFKASQKTGQRLKVSSDRLGEAESNKSNKLPTNGSLWHIQAICTSSRIINIRVSNLHIAFTYTSSTVCVST